MLGIFSRQWQKRDFSLDKVVALFILCTTVPICIVSVSIRHYGIYVPAILATSSLLYLLLRGKLSQSGGLTVFREANRIRAVSHVIFLISLCLSVWVLRGNLYYRPPLYFVLCLVAAASIVLDIFCLSEAKTSHIVVALFKIIALSLAIYGGIYYLFPGFAGSDPWWHYGWIQETVAQGHITEGQFFSNSGYYLYPYFQLVGAMTHTLTSLSIYDSMFASIGVFGAVSCLFIFLIGSKLTSSVRAGLLSALIVPLTGTAILRVTAIIPMSLGFYFVLAIMYLLFCRDRRTFSDTLLLILLSISVIFTHMIATAVLLLTLVAIFVGMKSYKRIGKPIINALYEPVSLTFVALFGVTMFTKWMQVPPGGGAFFDYTLRGLARSLEQQAQFLWAAGPTAHAISYGALVLNQAGYFLLLFLAIIGSLVYLHPRNRTGRRTALMFTTGLLIVTPYAFGLFGLTNIAPSRWNFFFYAGLAILAVPGLMGLASIVRRGIIRPAVIMFGVLVILFTMITNTSGNGDSPFFYNGADRNGFTQSELSAIHTLSDMGYGRPETDLIYGNTFVFVLGYDKYMEMVSRDNRIFVQRNYHLRHPEWNSRYSVELHVGIIGRRQVGKSVVITDYVKEQGINRGPLIYSNPNVTVYAMPEAPEVE